MITHIHDDKQPIDIYIDRTNGGNGRINTIKIYHKGKLKCINHIYLNGYDIQTKLM